jgi:hypothetical protein
MKAQFLLSIVLLDSSVEDFQGNPSEIDCLNFVKQSTLDSIPKKGDVVAVGYENLTVRDTMFDEERQELYVLFCHWPISEEDDIPDTRYYDQLKSEFLLADWSLIPNTEPEFEPKD